MGSTGERSRVGETLEGAYALEQLEQEEALHEVYGATDQRTGAPVRVTVLKPEYALNPGLVEMFMDEPTARMKQPQPDGPKVLAVGSDETGIPFVVEEPDDARSSAASTGAYCESAPAGEPGRITPTPDRGKEGLPAQSVDDEIPAALGGGGDVPAAPGGGELPAALGGGDDVPAALGGGELPAAPGVPSGVPAALGGGGDVPAALGGGELPAALGGSANIPPPPTTVANDPATPAIPTPPRPPRPASPASKKADKPVKKEKPREEVGSEFDIPTEPEEEGIDFGIKPHPARRGLELDISDDEKGRFEQRRWAGTGRAPWNEPGAHLREMQTVEEEEPPLDMKRAILLAVYGAMVMFGVPLLYEKSYGIADSLMGDYARISFLALSFVSVIACVEFYKSVLFSQELLVRVVLFLLMALTATICLATLFTFLDSETLVAVGDLSRSVMGGLAVIFFGLLAVHGFVRGGRAFSVNVSNAAFVILLSVTSVYASFYVVKNTVMAGSEESDARAAEALQGAGAE
jgi:hypothetical protein